MVIPPKSLISRLYFPFSTTALYMNLTHVSVHKINIILIYGLDSLEESAAAVTDYERVKA